MNEVQSKLSGEIANFDNEDYEWDDYYYGSTFYDDIYDRDKVIISSSSLK